MFFETSAKTAHNVETAFFSTALIILENINKGEYDLSNEVPLPSTMLTPSPYRALASNQGTPCPTRLPKIKIIRKAAESKLAAPVTTTRKGAATESIETP